MAIQLVLEFCKSRICPLASALPWEGRSPRTGTASTKPLSSAQERADRGGRPMPAIRAATGVHCPFCNVGSHQKGGPALSRGFWGSPGARPHLQSAQRTPAECNVCFASSRLCRILLFHFQEHRGENHPMALEKPVLLVSVLEL